MIEIYISFLRQMWLYPTKSSRTQAHLTQKKLESSFKSQEYMCSGKMGFAVLEEEEHGH